jgi:hypothetical protein
MIAKIKYIYYYNVQFLNNVTIIKTKVLIPRAYVTLADFCYSVLVLLFPNTVKLFGFPIFRYYTYLRKGIPECLGALRPKGLTG